MKRNKAVFISKNNCSKYMKLFSFEIVKIGLEENVLTVNQTSEGRTIVFNPVVTDEQLDGKVEKNK